MLRLPLQQRQFFAHAVQQFGVVAKISRKIRLERLDECLAAQRIQIFPPYIRIGRIEYVRLVDLALCVFIIQRYLMNSVQSQEGPRIQIARQQRL